MTDPFAHHPELKALITPPEQSGLRDLRPETLISMLKEKGVDATWIRTEEEREALHQYFVGGWGYDEVFVETGLREIEQEIS